MSKETKVCSFCNKEFSRKYNYSRHLQTCKLKPSEEINKLLAEKDKQLSEKDLEIKIKDEEIIFLKGIIENQLNKPTTINNYNAPKQTSNISINNLNVKQIVSKLEATDYQDVSDYIHLLNDKYIDQGPEGFAYFLCDHPYKEKFITTDNARGVLCYKNKKQEIVRDPEGAILINKSLKNNAETILEKATDRKNYWKEQIDDDIQDEFQEKEMKKVKKIKELIQITQQAKDNKLIKSQEIKNAIDVFKKNGFITIQKITQDLVELSSSNVI